MVSLVKRSMVKLAANIALADTLKNGQIDAFSNIASSFVESFCRRKFEKTQRVEYFNVPITPYGHEAPFKFSLIATPVDPLLTLQVRTASNGIYNGTTALPYTLVRDQDYILDETEGQFWFNANWYRRDVFKEMTYVNNNRGVVGRGVEITYTGGYVLVPDQPSGDPFDDFNYVDVPEELMWIIATKVAKDLKAGAITRPDGAFGQALRPYVRPRLYMLEGN